MCDTRIRIENIDFYQKNADLTAEIGVSPPRLNSNTRFLEKEHQAALPELHLNIEVEDAGGNELFLESLLDYIRQKKTWPDDVKPDFVMGRKILKDVTSAFEGLLEFQVVRHSGVIYIRKVSENYESRANFGAVFAHFMTKQEEGEPISDGSVVHKSVLRATFPVSNYKHFTILYSAEVDALDENDDKCELKVLGTGLNTYHLQNSTQTMFWQSTFGNVKALIIGSRTFYDKEGGLPKHTLYRVNKYTLPEIYRLMIHESRQKRFRPWYVASGERRLEDFLRLAERSVRCDGDSAILYKQDPCSPWQVEQRPEEVREFQETVRKYITF